VRFFLSLRTQATMILNPYPSHPHFPGLLASLQAGDRQVQYLEGLAGSSRCALIHACLSELKGAHLVIFQDKEEAAYFYTDLVTLDRSPERTLFFPPPTSGRYNTSKPMRPISLPGPRP
jgi:hypothetical protein